jgi:hypothetical protein
VTNDTDTFVQEVDESLRQDRVLNFLRRHGVWLIVGVIVVLGAVGGWQLWRNSQLEAARTHSEAYVAAQDLLRQGDLEAAADAFRDLREEGPRAYRVMARMEYAAILQAQGDLDGALAEFDAAAEATNDSVLRDSARMRAAYIAAETQDFPALQARLQPIIEDGGRLSYLAQELLAIEAWEAGETDLARTTLENLTLAFDAPEAVRRRAQVALSVVGPTPADVSDGGAEAEAPEGESR